jgi:hypothetical protein
MSLMMDHLDWNVLRKHLMSLMMDHLDWKPSSCAASAQYVLDYMRRLSRMLCVCSHTYT